MKIKMLVSRSGSDGVFGPNDVIDVPDAEAVRMIEAGQCIPVREAPVERATKRTKTEAA